MEALLFKHGLERRLAFSDALEWLDYEICRSVNDGNEAYSCALVSVLAVVVRNRWN